MFRNLLEEQGGEGRGLFAPRALRLSRKKKKKALSAHYVPTTSARTSVAHRVQERVACPSWGAPPRGPKTWVMEVVERTEVKKGGLRALVQGTIKVVLIIARLIACRMRSFPSCLDFNGHVRQSPSVVASDSEGGMDEV